MVEVSPREVPVIEFPLIAIVPLMLISQCRDRPS